MTKGLCKTTIVIWSEYEPMGLEEVARDAIRGEAYCSSMKSVFVEKPKEDPEWDGNEFFDDDDEGDD